MATARGISWTRSSYGALVPRRGRTPVRRWGIYTTTEKGQRRYVVHYHGRAYQSYATLDEAKQRVLEGIHRGTHPNPHPDAPRSLKARGGPFEPGATVRFTREFLRSTGQYKGPEATGRWIVVPCDCSLCRGGGYVALNQPSVFDDGGWRHVNEANLERVRGSALANPTETHEAAWARLQREADRYGPRSLWCPVMVRELRHKAAGRYGIALLHNYYTDRDGKRRCTRCRKLKPGATERNPARQMALPWWTGKRLVTKASRARIEAAQDAFRDAVRRQDYPSPRARADAIEAARERVGEIQAQVHSEAARALRLRENPRKWDEVSREQWNGYLAALSARGARKEWRSAQSPGDKAKGQAPARVQYVAVDGRDVGMTWTEMPWGERRFFIPARGRRPRQRFGETITPNPRRRRRTGRSRAR